MPQRNLFDATLDWSGVRISYQDHTPDLDASFTTTIQVKRADGDWSTLIVHHWSGVMVDFLPTYSTSVMEAWLFGNPLDVPRAATKVFRSARRHKEAHSYD
jgi:hypothetical protein